MRVSIRRLVMLTAIFVVAAVVVIVVRDLPGVDEPRESSTEAPTTADALPVTDASPAVATSVLEVREAKPLDDEGREKTDNKNELYPGNAELAKIQLRYNAFDKNFVFPDGEQITIHYNQARNRPKSGGGGFDDNVSGGFFERLSEAAKEYPGQAIRLLEELEECDHRPKTQEELDQGIETVTAGVLPPPHDAPVEKNIAWLKAGFERCKGVTADMREKTLELLRANADEGHMFSALTFATETEKTRPEIAAEYYKRAWGAGFGSAGYYLYRIYMNRENVTHDDAVQAYAYYYVAFAVRTASYDGIEGLGESQEQSIEALRAVEARTPPNVIAAGRELAKQMISSFEGGFMIS